MEYAETVLTEIRIVCHQLRDYEALYGLNTEG